MASILETHSNNNNNWTIANINHRFGDVCALCSMIFLNFAKRSYDKWMIGQRTMNRVNKPGYLKICDCKLSIQNRSHQINLSSHRIGHIIYSPQSASPYCLLECRSKNRKPDSQRSSFLIVKISISNRTSGQAIRIDVRTQMNASAAWHGLSHNISNSKCIICDCANDTTKLNNVMCDRQEARRLMLPTCLPRLSCDFSDSVHLLCAVCVCVNSNQCPRADCNHWRWTSIVCWWQNNQIWFLRRLYFVAERDATVIGIMWQTGVVTTDAILNVDSGNVFFVFLLLLILPGSGASLQSL